jgi:hypothetical protein
MEMNLAARVEQFGRESVGFFSDNFWSFPLGKNSQLAQESTRKNREKFRLEYCLHVPAISGVSLQDTVTFTHLSCRVLRDRVAGIFDLCSGIVTSIPLDLNQPYQTF